MSNYRPADRVPTRTDADAKRRFFNFLGRSLSAVCKNAVWIASPRTDGTFAAITNPPIIRLRRDEGNLYLRSTLEFTYADDDRFGALERKVVTLGYAHTVGESDSLKPQLYSWEWAAAEPTYPHVHLRRSDPAFEGLGKLHIPTGRVFYEDVLRFLVDEHRVQPARDDWRDVLDDSHRRVAMFASWGAGLRRRAAGSDESSP
ncbi:MAG TPA: hypothetical protein VIJ60_02055 [Acidimicrobiales bacterium]